MNEQWIQQTIAPFLQEDSFHQNANYGQSLPKHNIMCSLKIKSDLILAGLPFFNAVFSWCRSAVADKLPLVCEHEGKHFKKAQEINFVLPADVAISGERVALNLLQKASSIATFTQKFVDKANKLNVAILDTRKTTPGLRTLEKYAVTVGGGHNHRMAQSDVWMIKDNHKSIFGGLKEAFTFFTNLRSFYTPIVCEIHDEAEFEQAIELKVKHVMLDNFSPGQIAKLLALKPSGMTIEVSGGISLDNIDEYLIEGVDAISIGSLTYAAAAVDISLKMKPI